MFDQVRRNSTQTDTDSGILSGKGAEMSAGKDTVQYRWEAYNPDSGAVAKRGPIRDDYSKVKKYADEIIAALPNAGKDVDGWHLAPYWEGLQVRIVARTITPWVEHQTKPSDS